MQHQLQLKKFSLDMITDDCNIVLIGKKNTGKSFLVRDILFHKKTIPVGTVVSATEHANRFYGDFVPKAFIHNQYKPEIVNNAILRQKLILKKIAKEKKVHGYSNIDPRTFLVLDDCMYDDSWTRETGIREIFMNGRHFKFSFLVTMQYALGIPPILRSNVDYAFILRETSSNVRKKIYENYASMFPTFDVFCQVLDACTENFECLVVANKSRSNQLQDQVFWFKASERPQFRMGSPEFWAAGGDDEDDEEFDIDDELQALSVTARRQQGQASLFAPSKRKGPAVLVRKKV